MPSGFSLETLLPFKSNFKNIAGHKMHYLDEGSGPVVLLLHGNPTWCFYYRNLIKELLRDFRVIAPDYIGCGLSDHPAHRHFRASDRINQMQEFVESLNLTKYSIVMHDWGGPIGTGLAGRNIAAVEKLVYLNTTLTETESLPKIIKSAARPIIGKFLTKYSMRFLKLMTTFGVVKRLPKEVERGYYYPYGSIAARTAIWDFVADIPFDSSHPSYSEMLEMAERIQMMAHIPVQIIWGLKDPCFHKEMLNKVFAHFPHANVLEIPEASHLVLEDASELAANTVRTFLSAREMPKPQAPSEQVGTLNCSPVNKRNSLYESFQTVAQELGAMDAAIVPQFSGSQIRYLHVNYRDLALTVNKYQRGLQELGLLPGDRVLMLVPSGIDFLALTYAVIGRGAVPVFVDPGIGSKPLQKCIADIAPAAFIGSRKAQLLRLVHRKAFSSLKFSLTASDWCINGLSLAFLRKFSSAALPAVEGTDVALIAFTSGATGTPKGVIFTHEMVEAQLAIFSKLFKMQAGTRDLPLLPIFSLFTVAIGVASVFPPIDPKHPLSLDAAKIVKIINDLDIRSSFGSPTLWNKITEYCIRSTSALPSLKRVFMAGAPVPIETLAKLQGVLENGEAFTPYGSTEALPVTLISGRGIRASDILPALTGEIGTLVGKPVDGIELRIIQPRDDSFEALSEVSALPPRTIGEIIVSGKNVSPTYLNRPDATKSSKIKDGTRFWHRMGDLGYLDEAGNLYFCGRKVHMIRLGERTYYSIPTERVFDAHRKIRRSALISLYGGQDVGLAVEPLPQFFPDTEVQKEAFRKELLELAASNSLTSEIKKFFFHPSFPVDSRHNAKIFRDKLGSWASEAPYDRAA